jgi:cytochrome P450
VFSSPAERNELMLATIKEFSTYFVPLIEAPRTEPKGDLVSAMVAAIDNESLSDAETPMVAIAVMVAGNETTTTLIGRGFQRRRGSVHRMKDAGASASCPR